jgi:hypothetical protein
MDRDHAAARRIVSRGLLAQTHTAAEPATGIRTIRTVVEGTVRSVCRPKRTTRGLRRARRQAAAPPRPPGPKTTPGKTRLTPSRPTQPPVRRALRATGQPAQAPAPVQGLAVKTSHRMPDVRTVPATTPTRVVQRPAGHDTQAPIPHGPVPGHGVPAPGNRPEDHLPTGYRARLSRGTCRRRTRAAERTGFHHAHATEVHTLTPRFGPHHGDRTRPRRARKA